jgi:hypothetical protein
MVDMNLFDSADASLYDIHTHARGPSGSLPLTAEILRERPSGDLFGWSMNAGMGWAPAALGIESGGRDSLCRRVHRSLRWTLARNPGDVR